MLETALPHAVQDGANSREPVITLGACPATLADGGMLGFLSSPLLSLLSSPSTKQNTSKEREQEKVFLRTESSLPFLAIIRPAPTS